MNSENTKRAFTLAETFIVLTVLGIVAMMTVPSLLQHQQEVTNRTKIKKAISDYEKAVQNIIIENDIHSGEALAAWNNAEDNITCGKSSRYFKISRKVSEDSSCKFKTSDGLWWNIDNIMKPIISLKEEELDDTTKDTTFQLVTSYDANAKAFRTNDLTYESTGENKDAMKKLFSFINNEEDDDEVVVDASRTCSDDTKNNSGNYVSCTIQRGEVCFAFGSIINCEAGVCMAGYCENGDGGSFKYDENGIRTEIRGDSIITMKDNYIWVTNDGGDSYDIYLKGDNNPYDDSSYKYSAFYSDEYDSSLSGCNSDGKQCESMIWNGFTVESYSGIYSYPSYYGDSCEEFAKAARKLGLTCDSVIYHERENAYTVACRE